MNNQKQEFTFTVKPYNFQPSSRWMIIGTDGTGETRYVGTRFMVCQKALYLLKYGWEGFIRCSMDAPVPTDRRLCRITR